jgi:hypothetical protein
MILRNSIKPIISLINRSVFMIKPFEFSCYLIKGVQAIIRSYPKQSVTILEYGVDIAVADRSRIGRIKLKNGYIVSIISVKSVPGAKPEKSILVL